MIRHRIAWVTFVAALLAACGDSQTTKPDGTSGKLDSAPPKTDMALVDQGQTADRPSVDKPKGNDASSDGQAKDSSPDTTPVVNDTCAHAAPVTLTSRKATINGTTANFTNEFGTTIKCGLSYTMSGPQAYYSLAMAANKVYRFRVTASFSYGFFYVFSSNANCVDTNINSDCASGSTGATVSLTKTTPTDLYFKPASAGTYLFAVDSSSATSSGTFSIEIEEQDAAINTTCQNPDQITLVGGKATVNGNTFGAADEFSTVNCGGYTAFVGSQVYYRLPIAAGKAVKIKLTPTFSAYMYVFSASGGCSSSAINTYCGSGGATGDLLGPVSAGTSKTLAFSPTTADDYIIAVDSSSASKAGSFVLEVEEFTPPTNGVCTGAEVVTLTAGKATIVASTTGAKDQFSTLQCGGYVALKGPQLYYQLQLSADKVYQLTLNPTFSAYLYVFSSAANCDVATIESDCASGGLTGDLFGYTSSKETYWFTPSQTGTYYLAVDSNSNTNQGDFSLEIEEITPPSNSTCAAATNVTLNNGKATITGTTVAAKPEFTDMTCGSYWWISGPQVYYQLTAAAGKGYKLTLNPSFEAYLIAFSAAANCQADAVDADCSSDGGTGNIFGSSSSKSTYYFAPINPGTYLLSVESDAVTSQGSFTLDIEEFDLPTNTTCSNAQQVTLTSGSATLPGSTQIGVDDEFSSLQCGTSSTFSGPQLYYRVDLQANHAYRFRLSPEFRAAMYVFPASANCDQTNIETACASKGASGDVLDVASGKIGSLYFTPTTDGTYIIGVDSTSFYRLGAFTLYVDEMTTPSNGTCATATQLTFTSGMATAESDTANSSDEYPSVQCGLSNALAGPQLYYKLDLTGGMPYTINLTTTFAAYLVIFSSTAGCSAAGIENDCASGGATGNVLAVDHTSSNLSFTPPTTGIYYIAIDSLDATAGRFGWFRLTVKEPPPMPSFTAPFSWDFESNCQGLFATNDWVCGHLSLWTGVNCDSSETPPTAGHSGTGMWATGLNQCYSPLDNASSACNAADPNSASILGFKVDIPSTWTTATLTYWAWDDYNLVDWSEVRINGTPLQQFCKTGDVPTIPVWTQRTIDLKSYVGKTVQIEFHFYATSVSQYAGWFIDDLSVTGS